MAAFAVVMLAAQDSVLKCSQEHVRQIECASHTVNWTVHIVTVVEVYIFNLFRWNINFTVIKRTS